MTASDLPVGAQFTIADSTDETIYTVTHQVPGLIPFSHLTYARYGPRFGSGTTIGYRASAWAGHTEVIAHPPMQATDSTPLPQCDP